MLISDRNRGFDYFIFGSALAICLIGIVAIYSATHTLSANIFWLKQLVWFSIGLVIMMAVILLDYQLLGKYARLFYIFTSLLLVLVLFGPEIRSAKSWFVLGPISFQPAELAKLSTIIMLAEHLSTKKDGLDSLAELMPPLLMTALPVFLILLQPDLGTVLIFFPFLMTMLYLTGSRPVYLIVLITTTCLSGLITFFLCWSKITVKSYSLLGLGLVYKALSSIEYLLIFLTALFLIICGIYYIWRIIKVKVDFNPFLLTFVIITISFITAFALDGILKDYQKKRLLVFIDPSIAPLTAGYNIIQSKIAIGSGKLFGKGLLHGTQSQLGFLPERQADFIFSVIGEEFGFLGSIIILLLFMVIIYRGFAIAFSSRDLFGSLLAAGIATMLGSQAFFNIGISTGIMPVTGLTLPLVSYGGSSLVVTMTALGILINIQLRRYLI